MPNKPIPKVHIARLDNSVVFKKLFRDPEVLNEFLKDLLGLDLQYYLYRRICTVILKLNLFCNNSFVLLIPTSNRRASGYIFHWDPKASNIATDALSHSLKIVFILHEYIFKPYN